MDLIKVPQGRDKTFLKHSYPKIVGGTSQMKLFFFGSSTADEGIGVTDGV